jgi:hypothetical protein
LIMVLIPGCSDAPDLRDQRLAEFAQRSLEEQSKQNDLIARQSQSVVEESQKLAEASKVLVERDSEARRELISAHEKLNAQLNEQRAAIEANRDHLELERKLLAKERHRDPIIAATIQSVALILAALLPLLVSVFVIVQMRRPEPDDAAVAELLTMELVSNEPLLLPGPVLRPAIEHREVRGQEGRTPIENKPADGHDPSC